MPQTVRARYVSGALQPLEALDLNEGDEVLISVGALKPSGRPVDGNMGAGGWVGLVDAEQLKRDIYASRQVQTRTFLSRTHRHPRAALDPSCLRE